MLIDILWYFTAIFAIWSASLGGISVPMVGLLYPFRIIAVLLTVILLFKSKKTDWKIKKSTCFTIIPLVVYMTLHAILSLIWSQDQLRTARAILNFIYVAMFLFQFFRMVRDKRTFHNFLIALSLNFVVLLLLGIYETYSGNYLFNDPAGIDVSWRTNAYHVFYPVVCFTNPNDFAFVISLTTPFMLYLLDEAFKIKKWQRTAGKLAVIALTFFNMMNTCSRLGYITYFIVMAIYLFLQIRKSIVEAVVMGALTCIVVLSLTGMIDINLHVGTSADGVSNNVEPITVVNEQDTSTSIRLILIEKGLRVTRDTWGLGAGAKNSPVYMARYTDIPSSEDFGITDYHFFYMELLAEYGVIPFLMFLCFQAGAFSAAIYILRKKPELRWLAVCTLPGIVGFVFASANCSSSMFIYIMWIQFAVWSFMTAPIGTEIFCRKMKRNDDALS
jgi:teichuronic acid biosynthesis protein TuaE